MDWERVMEENMCLKKQLQGTRHDNDRLREELGALRLEQEEAYEKYGQLNGEYTKLAKKHQMQASAYQKDVSSYAANIEELKQLIGQKQLELDNFQIKMIPNLDQDMVRVKLIAEMEGPYQEAVDKKDKQITRLKEKLSTAERKQSLAQIQLDVKEGEFKKELEETKDFYSKESEKMRRELSVLVSRRQDRDNDRQRIRNQRKQLEELRVINQNLNTNEEEMRRQLTVLKVEKEKMYKEMKDLKDKKAVEEYMVSENTQVQAVRAELHRVQEQCANRQAQVDRAYKKVRTLEEKHRNSEDQWRRSHQQDEQGWKLQKQTLQDELRSYKYQLSRAEQEKDQFERENSQLKHSLERAKVEQARQEQENGQIKDTIADLERTIKQLEASRKQKLTLSKHLDREQEHHKENYKRVNYQQKKEGESAKMTELESMVSKLKQRLEQANRKIVELLKEKASRGGQAQVGGRNRAVSSFQPQYPAPESDKTLLLEYRDTGLTPLVRPTIMMHD